MEGLVSFLDYKKVVKFLGHLDFWIIKLAVESFYNCQQERALSTDDHFTNLYQLIEMQVAYAELDDLRKF